ncbi:hypothetical protein EVG20_g6126 [Dentipellis fragilis]|uniref:Uncharacterized protein n=1 Tax=Dentipellis fragilis TaxID=205917 RepID=A0A4Y9YQG6_9AGAM|nr:hypothetical protein EVG20_g6126 [Dentipellis fragilis]
MTRMTRVICLALAGTSRCLRQADLLAFRFYNASCPRVNSALGLEIVNNASLSHIVEPATVYRVVEVPLSIATVPDQFRLVCHLFFCLSMPPNALHSLHRNSESQVYESAQLDVLSLSLLNTSPNMPSTAQPSTPSNAPDNAPSKMSSVQEPSLASAGTKACPGALQSAEPMVPTPGTVGVAPSSGRQRTRKTRTDAQSQARAGQELKKPVPYDETGAYPVAGEERFNTKKCVWECPFPGCDEEVRDTEGDMGKHFAQDHPLKGGGKYDCALLVKEKTGSQDIRRCAKSYEKARGLGRHVLVFHMELGQKMCPMCGESVVCSMEPDGSVRDETSVLALVSLSSPVLYRCIQVLVCCYVWTVALVPLSSLISIFSRAVYILLVSTSSFESLIDEPALRFLGSDLPREPFLQLPSTSTMMWSPPSRVPASPEDLPSLLSGMLKGARGFQAYQHNVNVPGSMPPPNRRVTLVDQNTVMYSIFECHPSACLRASDESVLCASVHLTRLIPYNITTRCYFCFYGGSRVLRFLLQLVYRSRPSRSSRRLHRLFRLVLSRILLDAWFDMFLLAVYAVVAVCSCLLAWKLLRQRVRQAPLRKISGPPSASFLKGNSLYALSLVVYCPTTLSGNLPQVYSREHGWDFHSGILEKFGMIVRLHGWVGDTMLYVSDPRALHNIIVKDQYIFEETSGFISNNLLNFGPGLLLTLGDHHHQQRKLLNPVFSRNHMRYMIPIFQRICGQLRDQLVERVQDGPQDVEIIHWMTATVLELIGQARLGYSFECVKIPPADPVPTHGILHVPALGRPSRPAPHLDFRHTTRPLAVPALSRRTSRISVSSSLSDSTPVSDPKSPSASVNTFGPTRIPHSPPLSHIHEPPIHPDGQNPRVSMGHSISEEDPIELSRLSLDEINRATPSPMLFTEREPAHTTPPAAEDSISSINMADLPAADDDDDDDAAFDLAAQALHLEMHAARSKSSPHKSRIGRAMRSDSSPNLPNMNGQSSKSFPSKEPVGPFPSTAQPDGRASSPDISTIMAATPRPRQRSTSSVGSRPRSVSSRRVRSATPKSLPGSRRTSAAASAIALHRRQSEGETIHVPSSNLAYMQPNSEDDAYWNEDSYVDDYGVVLRGGHGLEEIGSALEDEQNDGEYDSDSSIDLHTPLPNLMLRDGMLSPHSKILPQNSRTPSPLLSTADGGRPGSILSVASTAAGSMMTKSGIFKDERDTVKRRVRHRDGRLLRGGIGLTTGLGWSDSEDEDAPSPLTKRLSTLSKKSSSSSLRPHPLSRSYSAGESSHNARRSVQSKGRSSLPPTSWVPSNSNASALSLSIPEHMSDPLPPKTTRFSEPLPGSVAEEKDVETQTPSTSSSSSLVAPATPGDVEDAAGTQWGRDKTLPPVPNLRRIPSAVSTRSATNRIISSPNFTQSTGASVRPGSSASSSSSVGASMGHGRPRIAPSTPRLSPSTTPRSALTPRPLQLPSVLAAGLQPGEPAVKTGLLGYNRNLHDKQRSRTASGPSMPSVRHDRALLTPQTAPVGVDMQKQQMSSLGNGSDKPKPRTGTGMAYRKSSNSSTAQTRMRLPSTNGQRPVPGTAAIL